MNPLNISKLIALSLNFEVFYASPPEPAKNKKRSKSGLNFYYAEVFMTPFNLGDI